MWHGDSHRACTQLSDLQATYACGCSCPLQSGGLPSTRELTPGGEPGPGWQGCSLGVGRRLWRPIRGPAGQMRGLPPNPPWGRGERDLDGHSGVEHTGKKPALPWASCTQPESAIPLGLFFGPSSWTPGHPKALWVPNCISEWHEKVQTGHPQAVPYLASGSPEEYFRCCLKEETWSLAAVTWPV